MSKVFHQHSLTIQTDLYQILIIIINKFSSNLSSKFKSSQDFYPLEIRMEILSAFSSESPKILVRIFSEFASESSRNACQDPRRIRIGNLPRILIKIVSNFFNRILSGLSSGFFQYTRQDRYRILISIVPRPLNLLKYVILEFKPDSSQVFH